MNTTGKAARKRYGNRYDAKRHKTRRKHSRTFGKLPVSVQAGNTESFIRAHMEEE